MRPDGINGASEQKYQQSLPERIETVDVSNNNLFNEIDNISTDVDKKIQAFFSKGSEDDEKISANEKAELSTIKSSIMNLYYKVRAEYVKADDEVAKAYQKMTKNLLGLIQRTTSAQDGQNPYAVSLEPEVADASPVKVPSRMYWKKEQEDLKFVYEKLINPGGRYAGLYSRHQVKISGLLGFIGDHASRLDREQIAFIESQIREINRNDKSKQPDPIKQRLKSTDSSLPDVEKVKAYWTAMQKVNKSEGMTLKNALKGLGYTDAEIKRVESQI